MKSLVFSALTICMGIASAIAQTSTGDDAGAWREPDPENTLYLELEDGRVIIELAPQFAPSHAAQMKALVRQGFYDGLDFYRVIEGFVAQGGAGDTLSDEQSETLAIDAELWREDGTDLTFIPADQNDPFAPETGFVDGFPAARDASGRTWMVHCPRAIATARGDDINGGGTEFYIVLGQALRYLDQNLTVFGRVISGQRFVQRVPRGERAPDGTNTGTIDDPSKRAKILRMHVASDLATEDRTPIEVMRTDSHAFSELLEGRRNRTNAWFHVKPPQFLDVCAVPIPTRLMSDGA